MGSESQFEHRAGHALREIYEFTKDEGASLDDEDVTHIFNVTCWALETPGYEWDADEFPARFIG